MAFLVHWFSRKRFLHTPYSYYFEIVSFLKRVLSSVSTILSLLSIRVVGITFCLNWTSVCRVKNIKMFTARWTDRRWTTSDQKTWNMFMWACTHKNICVILIKITACWKSDSSHRICLLFWHGLITTVF